MKKYVCIIAFLLIGFEGLGQGNLQFNQVLTFKGEFITGSTEFSTTYTVPVGKVWKIEYLTKSKVKTATGYPYLAPVINGTPIEIDTDSNPIWLKSGDTIAYQNYGYYYASQSTYRLDGTWLISIIEYNIIP
jgi:hypothetical protein